MIYVDHGRSEVDGQIIKCPCRLRKVAGRWPECRCRLQMAGSMTRASSSAAEASALITEDCGQELKRLFSLPKLGVLC